MIAMFLSTLLKWVDELDDLTWLGGMILGMLELMIELLILSLYIEECVG